MSLGEPSGGSMPCRAGPAGAGLCWFAVLGFGARLLSGFLARPSAWRVLDGLIAVTMVALGATLLAGG